MVEQPRQEPTQLYLDPITGEPASHPVGTGIGAAVGGIALGTAGAALAVAGTALGATAGPLGAAAGAVAGGIVGGFVGHRVAESVHPMVAELVEDERLTTTHDAERTAGSTVAEPAGDRACPAQPGGERAPARGKVDWFGLSDRGRVRPENEDQFVLATLNRSLLIAQTSLSDRDHTRLFGGSQALLMAVADGMGGHAAGRHASAIAVRALEHYILNTAAWCFHLQSDAAADFTDDLQAAMEACQRGIQAAAEANAEHQGMGTTLTLAYIVWPRLYVVHVGDSRCYLLRPPRLERITRDHTLAQELIDRRVLAPADAAHSGLSHVLWNCLGGQQKDVRPEVYKATLQVGDTLLLCTDGLTRPIDDARLADLLQQGASAEESCRRLVEAANDAGGPDNITAVVARFLDADPTQAMTAVAQATDPRTAVVATDD